MISNTLHVNLFGCSNASMPDDETTCGIILCDNRQLRAHKGLWYGYQEWFTVLPMQPDGIERRMGRGMQ
jgi:hypothetical protein